MRKAKAILDLSRVESVRYKELFTLAVQRMETVLGSTHYLEALREEIENSNKLEGELSRWKNKSVEEIYDQHFNSYDPLTATWYFNLYLETYFTARRVIGYGVGSDDITRVNTKYLSAYTADDLHDLKAIGSNLIHEHLHDREFDHDFKATSRRKNSLCYLANEAYEIAFDKIFFQQEPQSNSGDIQPAPRIEVKPIQTKRVCKRIWYTLWTKQVCWIEEVK